MYGRWVRTPTMTIEPMSLIPLKSCFYRTPAIFSIVYKETSHGINLPIYKIVGIGQSFISLKPGCKLWNKTWAFVEPKCEGYPSYDYENSFGEETSVDPPASTSCLLPKRNSSNFLWVDFKESEKAASVVRRPKNHDRLSSSRKRECNRIRFKQWD